MLCSLNVRGKPILNSATAAVQVTAQAASGSGGARAPRRPGCARLQLLRDTPELHALVRSVGGYQSASSFCGRTRVLWSTLE